MKYGGRRGGLVLLLANLVGSRIFSIKCILLLFVRANFMIFYRSKIHDIRAGINFIKIKVYGVW